jgi:hypothetical protein
MEYVFFISGAALRVSSEAAYKPGDMAVTVFIAFLRAAENPQ